MRALFALFTALLLVLAGCGTQGTPPEPPASPSSPASQEAPEPPAPEEPASQPEAAEPSNPDDTLAREMILAYGGEVVTKKDGDHFVTKQFNLFQMPYSWTRPEEIPPACYDLWFLASTFEEEDRLEKYADPQKDGWVFPQEVYEERIGSCFGATPEHLRRNPGYDPQEKCYRMEGGGDGGAQQEIAYTYQRQKDYMILDITLEDLYGNSWASQFRLIADFKEDGGWVFRSCECQPGELPQWGEERGNTAVLTKEQWDLLDRAEDLVRAFEVDPSFLLEESAKEIDYDHPAEIGGQGGYYPYTGDQYTGLDDLRDQLCRTLTPDFFDRLNQYGTFAEQDGRLYILDGCRGTNLAYLEAEDRFTAYTVGEELIVTRYAYYADSAPTGTEKVQATQVRAMPMVLKNTQDGWRVDFLRLPN